MRPSSVALLVLGGWGGGGGGDEGEARVVDAPLDGGHGAGEDRRTPGLDGGDDVLGLVGHEHLLMRGQRHHRVWRRVDGDDQVGVEVEDLSPRGETVESDHTPYIGICSRVLNGKGSLQGAFSLEVRGATSASG